MKKWQWVVTIVFTIFVVQGIVHTNTVHGDEESEGGMEVKFHQTYETTLEGKVIPDPLPRFAYDSGLNFEYPDAVRGIYVTAHSAGGSRFDTLINYVNDTALNSMVIDVKDDDGLIAYDVDDDVAHAEYSRNFISDPRAMLERLEEEEIYPIARLVVFKDTNLAMDRPEWSFTRDGDVWVNGRNEAFVNPFVQDVWDYNIEIAKEAAELGFKEIQFDYVRFPEGFENLDEELDYTRGDYDDASLDNVKERVRAVTEFVAYAREELSEYDVDVSVDIFGYAATIEEAPGIGQNFAQIADNVDVISSMIYPSHWTPYFDIPEPDREPYNLVDEYAQVENDLLDQLDEKPVSRPWLQDFTANWLYSSGQAFVYGPEQVEAQIQALYDNGIYEYLLWAPQNSYTEGVNYDPQ